MAEIETSSAPEPAASSDHVEGIQWWSMRSKRTEALPKHSLFGTALENIDKESLKNIEGKYMPEGYIRPAHDRYPLPDHLRVKIPGRDALDSSRRELNQQKSILTEAEQQLKLKADKALSFSEGQNRPGHSSYSQSSRPSWLTEKDLEHSKDINIVGLNQRGSYNRDKYGTKPKRHNYSLIGDILATNMDFTTPRTGIAAEKLDAYNKGRDAGWGRGRHLPYNSREQKKPSEKIQSVIDLPPNIRHKFGSKNCDRLLSDENLVSMTLDRQRTMSGPPRPSKKENVKGLPVDLEGNYESLGQATRYNVFPGLTTGHTISQTQKEFNDEVHLRRVPNPDEFRYQRDELSIWVEQDVLRKRREEKWQVYFDSLPKLGANWDRNATRSVIIAPKPQQKPKTRAKPRQKQEAQKEAPVEDEIVFVTPPLTPPPMQPDIVEVPKKFERDDAFWEFFDQDVPR